MRLEEIGLERTSPQPDAGPVPGEMIAELMPLGHEPADGSVGQHHLGDSTPGAARDRPGADSAAQLR